MPKLIQETVCERADDIIVVAAEEKTAGFEVGYDSVIQMAEERKGVPSFAGGFREEFWL